MLTIDSRPSSRNSTRLRVDVALEQKVPVLLAAVVVHAAAGMPRRLIAQIERVVLGVVLQIEHARFERGVALPCASLRAVGAKLGGDDAHRHAGAAAVAVGAIGECAAAAKAGAHQLAVDLRVDGVAGRGDLRARQLVGQVAARVGRRRVELQYRERQVVELGHAGLGPHARCARRSKHPGRRNIG